MRNKSFIKKCGVAGLVKIAIVATIYAVTTITLGDLSYGPIQIRVSELLNFLAFIDPFYIPGLVLGCAVSNFYSFGIIDVFVGSLGTLIATYGMYKTKSIILASICPLINAPLVAAELYLLGIAPFWFSLGTIALSEFIIMTLIGIPLFKVLFKNNALIKSIKIQNNFLSKI